MDTMEAENALTGGEEQNFDISSDLIRGHINTIILRTLYDEDKLWQDYRQMVLDGMLAPW